MHFISTDKHCLRILCVDQKRRNIRGLESAAVLKHNQDPALFKQGSLSDIVENLPDKLISITDTKIIGEKIDNVNGTEKFERSVSIADKSSEVKKAGSRSLLKGKVFQV